MKILRTRFGEAQELFERAQEQFEKICRLGGPHASLSGKYRTLFGRDMAIMALLTMNLFYGVARDVIRTLALYQGVKEDSQTGESPGKIFHEIRRNGKYISYVAADSTPLFIILVGEYYNRVSRSILDERLPNGRLVRECVANAARWIKDNMRESLFVVPRRKEPNFYGQTLEDAFMAHIKTDGSLFAPTGFIAYCSLQGLAHDALVTAGKILGRFDLRILAQRMIAPTKQHFWDEERGFFVECIDEAEFKNPENGFDYALLLASARILNSELLFGLEEGDRHRLVRRIVDKLFSPEFLTEAGLRNRSNKYCDLCGGLADYGGSWTSYPIFTYLVAQGLRRHGFVSEALDLESRIIRTIKSAGNHQEFFFVDKSGHTLHQPSTGRKGTIVSFPAQFNPEPEQGWTMATVLAILSKWSSDGVDIDECLSPQDGGSGFIADPNILKGLWLTLNYLGDNKGLTGVGKTLARIARTFLTPASF